MATRKNNHFEQEKLRLEYLFEHGIDLKHRIIRITGPIGDATYEDFDCQLTEMERQNPRKTITVRINSPGGSVYDALAIVGRMQSSSCPITTEGYGHVMSAATLILAAGKKRKLSEFCWFMHHKSQYMVGGSHDEIADAFQQAEREENTWAKWMERLTNQPAKFWLEGSKKRDMFLTAEECLEHGVVDEII